MLRPIPYMQYLFYVRYRTHPRASIGLGPQTAADATTTETVLMAVRTKRSTTWHSDGLSAAEARAVSLTELRWKLLTGNHL
jgi:hypothetical protein